MLNRWSSRYGVHGTGVDLSEVFLTAARERANELNVTDHVQFIHSEAATYAIGKGRTERPRHRLLHRRHLDRQRPHRHLGPHAPAVAPRRPDPGRRDLLEHHAAHGSSHGSGHRQPHLRLTGRDRRTHRAIRLRTPRHDPGQPRQLGPLHRLPMVDDQRLAPRQPRRPGSLRDA
ncbi:SAM-dependent methyltransferase [Nonomuraea sp. NPDC059023]|uniref:SAM-dependent methyltransferase n=1 Tax=unclassified Nonomuraea TaxID=2593643 RepID=UPI00369F00DC